MGRDTSSGSLCAPGRGRRAQPHRAQLRLPCLTANPTISSMPAWGRVSLPNCHLRRFGTLPVPELFEAFRPGAETLRVSGPAGMRWEGMAYVTPHRMVKTSKNSSGGGPTLNTASRTGPRPRGSGGNHFPRWEFGGGAPVSHKTKSRPSGLTFAAPLGSVPDIPFLMVAA